MLKYIFGHYLFCSIGAYTRFIYYRAIRRRDSKKLKFKDFFNYREKPDVEMLDAILGAVVLGSIVYIIFKFFNNNY